MKTTSLKRLLITPPALNADKQGADTPGKQSNNKCLVGSPSDRQHRPMNIERIRLDKSTKMIPPGIRVWVSKLTAVAFITMQPAVSTDSPRQSNHTQLKKSTLFANNTAPFPGLLYEDQFKNTLSAIAATLALAFGVLSLMFVLADDSQNHALKGQMNNKFIQPMQGYMVHSPQKPMENSIVATSATRSSFLLFSNRRISTGLN